MSARSEAHGACVEPRSGEAFFVLCFTVLNLVVPLTFKDLFPFTVMPMFSDAPRELWRLEVFDPEGNRLPKRAFSCSDLYLANPHPRIGVRLPPTLNRAEGGVSEQEIVETLRERLLEHPELPYIDVVQRRFGTITRDGRETVGTQEVRRWRITNEATRALPH
jgi:hypothetical protein